MSGRNMQKWEYRTDSAEVSTLNALGAEGWEVINVMTDTQRDGYGNSWPVYWTLLKRPVSSEHNGNG